MTITDNKTSTTTATIDDDMKKIIKSSSEPDSNPNPFLSDDLKLSMWIPAEYSK